jgi:hypothetical protein
VRVTPKCHFAPLSLFSCNFAFLVALHFCLCSCCARRV